MILELVLASRKGSGKKKAHTLKNFLNLLITCWCPWDSQRDKQGSTGWCPRHFMLFINIREIDRKGQFSRETGQVSQRHPAVQGVLILSYVPFLLPKGWGMSRWSEQVSEKVIRWGTFRA